MAKSTLQFYSSSNQFKELGDMLADALIEGTIGTPSEHKLTLTGLEGGKFVLKGDFDVVGGVITGGVITSYTAFVDGNKVIQGTNFDISWTEFKAALDQARSDDPGSSQESLFLLVLGADRTLGSTGDDLMFAVSPIIEADAGNDTIYSTFGDKIIRAGAGNDLIVAGVGNDKIFGEQGRDTFAFTGLGDAVDRIKDFKASKDKIGLDDPSDEEDDFFAVGIAVDLNEFVVGEEALTADHHLIYDQKTGGLYWDEDGVGGAGKTLLAVLPEKLKMTSANFVIDDYT